MRTKIIILRPKISLVWLGLTVSSVVLSVVMLILLQSYLMILFMSIYSITFILCQIKYQIDIYPNENKIIIYKNNKHYTAQLVGCCQLSFLLTLITLKYNNRAITFFIFIDSVSLVQYKKLRMFLQWN